MTRLKTGLKFICGIAVMVLMGCGEKSPSWNIGHCAAGDGYYVLGLMDRSEAYKYKDLLAALSKKYNLDYGELVSGYEGFKPTDSVVKSCGKTREYEAAKGFTFAGDRARAIEMEWKAKQADRETKERELRRKMGMANDCGFECELRKEEEKMKALKGVRQ